MGVRGELFTTQVVLDNRSYFFNVKENRNGDVFLQVVESKSKNGEDFDRHAIVVFAEDMQKFFKGLDDSLAFIDKDQKDKKKIAAEKRIAKNSAAKKDGDKSLDSKKRVYRKKEDVDERKPDGIKRTGKVHVVSKRKTEGEK